MTPSTPTTEEVALRRRAARVLAGAHPAELAERWSTWPEPPTVEFLRGPEAGHVMVQARTGGTGDRFNLGEATVCRATVVLRGGPLAADVVGTSYVMGSDPDHAGLAAVFDALLSDARQRERVLHAVIEPLEREQADRDAATHTQARSTVVNFLTVSREHR